MAAGVAAARLQVLQLHLSSGGAEERSLRRANCEAAEPSGKVCSAEEAAQLVPDGASVTVSACCRVGISLCSAMS